MNLIEAIYLRHSIRAFKPDPVPRDILVKVLEAATQAPSWANTQPWEFAVAGGTVLQEIKEAFHKRAIEGVTGNPDIPNPLFPDQLQQRRRSNGLKLYAHLDIGREDRERQREWTLSGLRFFDAPNAVFLHIDRTLNGWSIFDTGLVAQTFMLAALEYGLGTCPQAAVVRQPDVLRRILGMPDSRLIVVGIGIGYPDWDHPANSFRSEREPLAKVTTWHGV